MDIKTYEVKPDITAPLAALNYQYKEGRTPSLGSLFNGFVDAYKSNLEDPMRKMNTFRLRKQMANMSNSQLEDLYGRGETLIDLLNSYNGTGYLYNEDDEQLNKQINDRENAWSAYNTGEIANRINALSNADIDNGITPQSIMQEYKNKNWRFDPTNSYLREMAKNRIDSWKSNNTANSLNRKLAMNDRELADLQASGKLFNYDPNTENAYTPEQMQMLQSKMVKGQTEYDTQVKSDIDNLIAQTPIEERWQAAQDPYNWLISKGFEPKNISANVISQVKQIQYTPEVQAAYYRNQANKAFEDNSDLSILDKPIIDPTTGERVSNTDKWNYLNSDNKISAVRQQMLGDEAKKYFDDFDKMVADSNNTRYDVIASQKKNILSKARADINAKYKDSNLAKAIYSDLESYLNEQTKESEENYKNTLFAKRNKALEELSQSAITQGLFGNNPADNKVLQQLVKGNYTSNYSKEANKFFNTRAKNIPDNVITALLGKGDMGTTYLAEYNRLSSEHKKAIQAFVVDYLLGQGNVFFTQGPNGTIQIPNNLDEWMTNHKDAIDGSTGLKAFLIHYVGTIDGVQFKDGDSKDIAESNLEAIAPKK